MSYNPDVPNQPDGCISLHVDDMLGAGSEVEYSHSNNFAARVKKLRQAFQFRTWKQEARMDFCGGDLKTNDDGSIDYTNETYAKKVIPVSLPAERTKHPAEKATVREISKLRGLLGSLQWPATQSSAALQCTVSMLHGQISNATVGTTQEANKALRFFKNNADVGIKFQRLGESLDDLGFICMTDAAWGTRADGSSQGGYLIFMVNQSMLSGQEGPYVLLDWRSAKLTRMSRSSLNSESQAAAMGVDSLAYVKTFWALMRYP